MPKNLRSRHMKTPLDGAHLTGLGAAGAAKINHVATPHGSIGFAGRRILDEIASGESVSRSRVGLIDAEKSRIAAELHDHLGQLLILLKMDLERIKRQVEVIPGAVNESVEAAIGKTIEAIRDLRGIAHGLKPVALQSVDLVTALQNLLEDIRGRSGVETDFLHEDLPRKIGYPVKLAFFRIAQEALTNVIKHSKSTNVNFCLSRRGRALVMTVEDNGIGFDMERTRTGDRPALGLSIMEERAARIGGKLSIDSSKGHGTRLCLEIPLQPCSKTPLPRTA